MSDPYIGEIRLFAGTFAPASWAFCDGQLLRISEYDALFSLLGTVYGGDGRTTFGLPDLRGRLPLQQGAGPDLTPRAMGSHGGAERVALTAAELPPHGHAMFASSDAAEMHSPANMVTATNTSANMYSTKTPTQHLAGGAVTATGGGQSHTNLMPYTCIHFIIALAGYYPSRH